MAIIFCLNLYLDFLSRKKTGTDNIKNIIRRFRFQLGKRVFKILRSRLRVFIFLPLLLDRKIDEFVKFKIVYHSDI